MTAALEDDPAAWRGSARRGQALRLALAHYSAELRSGGLLSTGSLLLPALGNIALFYLPPLFVARLALRLGQDGTLTTSALMPYLLGFAGSLLVGEVLWRVGLHCLNRTDGYGIEHLYDSGMRALLAKDAAFFHDSFAGSLTKRLVSYASRYTEFVDTLAFSVVANLIPLAFACVVLGSYDWRLVVILLSGMLGTGLVIAPLIRRRQALVDAREAAWARVSGAVADTLGNIDAVRSFAAEAREAHAHEARVGHQRALAIRSWDYSNLRIDTLVAPLSVATNLLGLVIAVRIGAARDVESVVVTFVYFLQATRILFEFNQTYRRFESSLTDAAQFTELLLDPPTVLDPEHPAPLAPLHTGVDFEQVTFAHSGAAGLFHGLDLHIASGERVGLVGRSGGGKTTLTRLLLRQMDLQGGRILVGGQDIATLRQADLRSLIGYVPQDPAMFHRSLRDNIAFGRPEATEADVVAAAEAAHLTEFIASLPAGFDTLVGERGVKLSGGQRQRVAIARAILRDAPVLLLDEATSALDSESEALIQDALWELMHDRTALVVAHRLSTVARMDRLVVLDLGQVIESGTHAELLALGGLYSELWSRQSGGFLLDSPVPSRA
jgi:ATP-binding cassette subfamily B protein